MLLPMMTALFPSAVLTAVSAVLLAAAACLHLIGCLYDKYGLTAATKPALMPAVILLHVSICGTAHPYVIAALVFGWIGDIFLLIYKQNRLFFLLGMLSFLIGHIAYIKAAFAAGLPQAAYKAHGAAALICLAAVMLVGDALIFAFLYKSIFKKLKASCAVYILALSAMAFTMLYSCTAGFKLPCALLALGGLLFIVSDFVLSCRIFGVIKRRRMNFIVMITYVAAQTCLALGFALC